MPGLAAVPVVASDPAPAPTARPGQRHVPALDGIRGLAILFVLLHHISGIYVTRFGGESMLFVQLLRLGWCGVNLFFVLSGFLITGILLDARESPHYFRNFYVRRALRIFPLYFAVMVAVTIAVRAVPAFRPLFGEQSLAWTWLYATNIVIALYGGASAGVLDSFWSLAVEEHFYLAWPLFIYHTPRRTLLIALPLVWAVVVLARASGVLMDVRPMTLYVITPFRLDALVLGGLLALLLRMESAAVRGTLRRSATWISGVSAFALAIVLWYRGWSHLDPWMQGVGYALLDVLFAGLVLTATSGATHPGVVRVLSWSGLRSLGKYSYGLYVFHLIILRALMETDRGATLWAQILPVSLPPVPAFAVEMVCSLLIVAAVTYASWHVLEKRMLAFKRSFA